MTPNKSRRNFLRGAAGAALALPWLESLPLKAAAVSNKPPVRFGLVYFSNGVEPIHWWAKGAGATTRNVWHERPMTLGINDRFTAPFVPDKLGTWQYDVLGWVDHAETWRRRTAKKIAADVDVTLDLMSEPKTRTGEPYRIVRTLPKDKLPIDLEKYFS